MARLSEYPISVSGLMIIPPQHEDPTVYFKRVRSLADSYGLEHCMMGMSRDYRLAIEHGATQIRIGRVIFNPCE